MDYNTDYVSPTHTYKLEEPDFMMSQGPQIVRII